MNTGMETDDIDLPPVGAVLWSDFDPILEEYDEEAQSEASQFSHQAYKEVLVETESDSIAQEQPGKKMVITYEAGCSAIPQMEDLQTQATIEMETKASGNEEPDDWVKVGIRTTRYFTSSQHLSSSLYSARTPCKTHSRK